MYVEKLDAIDLHKFIKENLDETIKIVDLRKSQTSNQKVGTIYANSKQGLEPNFIIFNDTSFTISVSNHSCSKKLETLTPEDVNRLWQKFLYAKFGKVYLDCLIGKDQTK